MEVAPVVAQASRSRRAPGATAGGGARGRACTRGGSGAATSSSTDWPRPAPALADADLSWEDVHFVAGADTIRNGYPGSWPEPPSPRRSAGPAPRCPVVLLGLRLGAAGLATARAKILAGLCDVALVVGADTTPKGFFAPVGGDRQDDPDWLRFRLLGATNPAYFGLYARRRMDHSGPPTRTSPR